MGRVSAVLLFMTACRNIKIFDAFQQLSAGQLTDQVAVAVDYRTPAMLVIQHGKADVDDVVIRSNGLDTYCHMVLDQYGAHFLLMVSAGENRPQSIELGEHADRFVPLVDHRETGNLRSQYPVNGLKKDRYPDEPGSVFSACGRVL